jgi:hypothetical protein
MIDQHCHTSSIVVAVPAAEAFEIMADGLKQGEWAWGSWKRTEVEPGLYLGTSVFDGKQTYVRPVRNQKDLIVHYEVGRSKETLVFRNMAKVLPGAAVGIDPNHCVITLMSWRNNTQTDEAWIQLGTVHEAEMFLIKGLLERKKA